jgi:hypothetical protein
MVAPRRAARLGHQVAAIAMKSSEPKWLIWLVGLFLVGYFLWSQSHIRNEVRLAIRLGQRWSGGMGGGDWRDQSVFICMPGYVFSLKSYQVEASSEHAPRVTESTDWWPYMFAIGLVVYSTLWVIRGRQSSSSRLERGHRE